MNRKLALFMITVTLGIPASLAQAQTTSQSTTYQADWGTRSASCPAKVTKSTNIVYHLTGINDLLIDFRSGESTIYQLRVKSSPLPAVPENPFGITQSGLAPASCTDPTGTQLTASALQSQLNAIRAIQDPNITPAQGVNDIPLQTTLNAIQNHDEIRVVLLSV